MRALGLKEREERGTKIRDARLKLGLTQAQVSSKIGRLVNVIGELERGQVIKINEACLKAICELLNLNWEEMDYD